MMARSDAIALGLVIACGTAIAFTADGGAPPFGAPCGIPAAIAALLMLMLLASRSDDTISRSWLVDAGPESVRMGIVLDSGGAPATRARGEGPRAWRDSRSLLAVTLEARDGVIVAFVDAKRGLLRRIESSRDEAQRSRLFEVHDRLALAQLVFAAMPLPPGPDGEAWREAVERLRAASAELALEAGRIEAASDPAATAAAMIERLVDATEELA